MDLKRKVWQLIEVEHTEAGGSRLDIFDRFILGLIILNVVAAIFGTVTEIDIQFGAYLLAFEAFSVAVFSIEYLLRVWACVVDPAYSHPLFGRLRFVLTPMALIDLAAFLPFYLPALGIDLRFVRVLRLLRLFRVAKLGRYVDGLQLIGRVLRRKREELIVASIIWAFLLVISGSMMYYIEHGVQPDKFPDIPSTMWWAVMTLTTIGYGDVYPTSALGRLLASVIAVIGIGLFALPAAILGSAFIEAAQERKQKPVCPHCGKEI
jgi:voltage-gated potassium channel